MIKIKQKALCVIALLLISCSQGSQKNTHEVYGGQKIIFFGKSTDFKYFGKILYDWDRIHEAIYRYMPKDCIKNKLTVDLIESFDMSSGVGKNGAEIVFTIGTSDPCSLDSSSSGPIWSMIEKDGGYQVVSHSLIQE